MVLGLSFGTISYCHSQNLHNDQKVHSDLATFQVLVVLGCVGTLAIQQEVLKGTTTQSDLSRLQSCADNEGTDITAQVLGYHRKGEIEKARIQPFMIHYAVLLARQHNPELEGMKTDTMITQARIKAAQQYPYLPTRE